MCILSKFPFSFPWVSLLPSFSSLLPFPSAGQLYSQSCCCLCTPVLYGTPVGHEGGRKRSVYPQSTLLHLSQTQESQHCRDAVNCVSLCTGQICDQPLASVEDFWGADFIPGLILLSLQSCFTLSFPLFQLSYLKYLRKKSGYKSSQS